MAHTVESLAKLLKKSPDEVIVILANAGIKDKNTDSDISAEERKVLMASLSKRTGKSNISVSRKTTGKTSSASGGVKIQVKKKRSTQAPKTTAQDNEEAKKAREALESSRIVEQKLTEQDEKRKEMARQQQIENTKKQQEAKPDDNSFGQGFALRG